MEYVTFDAKTPLNDAPTRSAGTEVHLTLRDWPLDPVQLEFLREAMPRLRPRAILMFGFVESERLDALLALPGLEGLETLRWNETLLQIQAARVLANAPLPALRSLIVSAHGDSHVHCGDDGARAFATSRGRAALRELSLQRQHIGPLGAAALLSGALELTELDLSANPLGTEGIRAIVDAPRARHLASLAIGGVGLDVEGVRLLARSESLSSLRRLALATDGTVSGLTRESLEELIASPSLSHELVLELDGEPLGLKACFAIDGYSGQPCYPWWEGEPEAALAARYKIRVVGVPPIP